MLRDWHKPEWIVDATREAFHCARKTIGPIKDSAIEWVSFESIEIVMALGSSGKFAEYFHVVLGDIAALGQPLAEVSWS
jgi:hypothetical protein